MVRNMQIAQDLGLLFVPDGLVRRWTGPRCCRRHQVLLISTGSQGEPLSALSRMSRGEHRLVNLVTGDTVILASSMIPGNETSVFTVINELVAARRHRRPPGRRQGARLRARVGG